MLADLRALLANCPPDATFETYRTAIVEENVLGKPTHTTRKESFRRLRELYALNTNTLLFRALQELWDTDYEAQPMLALFCALARDALLSATIPVIIGAAAGAPVTTAMLTAALDQQYPGRYGASMLGNVGRNTASSWQQSGHLTGRLRKTRARAQSRPTAVAYALLLGYICGKRGELLFHTTWTQLLDAPLPLIQEQAAAAARQGWLEYRHAGQVIDVEFRHLLRNDEEDGRR